jgi:hypothetical protein
VNRKSKKAVTVVLLVGVFIATAYLSEVLWGDSEAGGLLKKCWRAIEPGT